MKKSLYVLLVLSVFGIALMGCSGADENESGENNKEGKEQSTHTTNQMDINDIAKEDVIGHINGVEMIGEDLHYEMKRLELIYSLSGDKTEASPTVAIQEFTRNQVIHQLAEEQNITIDENEQQERAIAVREDIASSEAYATVMEGVDEEKFWTRETERYEIILESEELISILMEEVKKENPDYTEQALRFEAQEDLEEWIQEKIAEMDIHFEEIVS